jgi:hypothetical protein
MEQAEGEGDPKRLRLAAPSKDFPEAYWNGLSYVKKCYLSNFTKIGSFAILPSILPFFFFFLLLFVIT